MKTKHVCYLIDGCRTYAILNSSSIKKLPKDAYTSGADTVEKVFRLTFDEHRIPFLTFAWTTRNNHLKRNDMMKVIPNAFPGFARRWLPYLRRRGVRVRFIGDTELFINSSDKPREVSGAIKKMEEETAGFYDYHLFFMVAYDSKYEYINFLSNTKDFHEKGIENLIKEYYGTNVPEIDFIIRSWRPRLSSCIPILVGEYADMYLFSGPFQYFDSRSYSMIINDYEKRIGSKGGGFRYSEGDLEKIRDYKGEIISKIKPYIIGSTIGYSWLPIPLQSDLREIEKQVRVFYNAGGAHDFDHAQRVRKVAREIAQNEGSDTELVEIAALLHDVIRPEDGDEERKHSELSARKAEEILETVGMPKEKIRRILELIRSHSLDDRKKRGSLEEMILFDADKIDALGEIGISRWFMYMGRKNKGLKEAAELYINQINKFVKERGKLYTETGNRMVWERLEFSRIFVNRLLRNIEEF
jgi:uncharacterized protein